MDFCDSTNIRLKKFGTIVNVSNLHWIYLQYDSSFAKTETSPGVPCVQTYDPLSGNDEHAITKRRWYAKYFGLSNKESIPNVKPIELSERGDLTKQIHGAYAGRTTTPSTKK